MTLHYYDLLGNSAVIQMKSETEWTLIIRDKKGKIEKTKTYRNLHGAKSALGRTGIWLTKNSAA